MPDPEDYPRRLPWRIIPKREEELQPADDDEWGEWEEEEPEKKEHRE